MTNKATVIEFLHQISVVMTEKRDYLIKIDGVVGDGDLGLTMSDGFTAAFDGVQRLGKAKVGEKTFLDGFDPCAKALNVALKDGDSLHDAAAKAAAAAEDGFKATVGMLAVHGRAATRGEESRKLEDPGAKVAALIFQAFAQAV